MVASIRHKLSVLILCWLFIIQLYISFHSFAWFTLTPWYFWIGDTNRNPFTFFVLFSNLFISLRFIASCARLFSSSIFCRCCRWCCHHRRRRSHTLCYNWCFHVKYKTVTVEMYVQRLRERAHTRTRYWSFESEGIFVLYVWIFHWNMCPTANSQRQNSISQFILSAVVVFFGCCCLFFLCLVKLIYFVYWCFLDFFGVMQIASHRFINFQRRDMTWQNNSNSGQK